MKKNIIYLTIGLFSVFIFTLFYAGLQKQSTYVPNQNNKKIIEFVSKDLFSGLKIDSKDIISKNKFTIINIWASWCLPCRSEHKNLMDLKNIYNVTLIGLNYKDKSSNAKKFINELGNPFQNILADPSGTISIEIGAYGIPETFVISSERKIIKKFIGPLTKKNIKEIVEIINQ